MNTSSINSNKYGELRLSGCKEHPHDLDLTCCKIRNADGTALTMKQIWEVLKELRQGKIEPIGQEDIVNNKDAQETPNPNT